MKIQRDKVWYWLIAAFLILTIPNIIFWVIQPKVFMIRGIFVLDYFFIACLFPFVSRKIFVIIWLLFAVIDLAVATSSLFFMDFFEIIHALTKLPDISFVGMLKWVGLLVLFISIIYALVYLMLKYNEKYPFLRFRFLWPLIVFVLLLDFFNGQGPLRHWSVKLYTINSNFVSAPTLGFMNTIKNALSGKSKKLKMEYLGSVAKTVFASQPDSVAAKKEVLILVESWGLIKDSMLQQEIVSPLYQLKMNQQFTLREGHGNFKFLTLAGELREITGYLFHSYQVKEDWVKQQSIFLEKQRQGYRVIGVHGFSSHFYQRKELWPYLGVQDMYFAEDLKKLSMSQCGDVYFHGICDTSINTWLLNTMNQQPQRKEFYYWVTLSTHLPLIEVHDEAYTKFAEKWKQRGITENILQMAYQHQLLFKDLANKLSKQASKAHILLVGDHAPPFIDPADRKLLNDHLVPYVELIPN